MTAESLIIDDLTNSPPASALGTSWRLFTDGVMGGISQGRIEWQQVNGRKAIHMTGDVNLENNGGFIQISLDLAPNRQSFDARDWKGIELDVFGNEEEYELRLRTSDLDKPWQSFRAAFQALPTWKTVRIPFANFDRHRTEIAFDAGRLRRLGLVAIGREFSADLALAGIRFYS